MPQAVMIRTIEELSLNALPALQTQLLDGWVLRFADGYTRRANSVNPLYAPRRDLSLNIAACEMAYTRRGLRPVFKLTPVAQPIHLEAALIERGYRLDARTSVQTLALDQRELPPISADLSASLDDEWLDARCALGEIEPARRAILAKMLAGLLPDAAYALVMRDGRPVACGLGVLQADYLGLYDIATDAKVRRQGLGARVVSSLLAWGRAAGAHTAYLQVMADNEPALSLYAKLGFRHVYDYWYRVKA